MVKSLNYISVLTTIAVELVVSDHLMRRLISRYNHNPGIPGVSSDETSDGKMGKEKKNRSRRNGICIY